jgi:hypothetical protein
LALPATGSAPAREATLRELARRGAKGGTIEPHRAMLRLPDPGKRLAGAVALAAIGVAGFIASLPYLGQFWTWLMGTAQQYLRLDGTIEIRRASVLGLVEFVVPTIALQGWIPNQQMMIGTTAVTAGVLGVSLLLRGRLVPLAYLLRALVVVQTTAIGFFWFWPTSFPYRIPEYIVGQLQGGLVVMGLVPVVLGFTFYLFDLSVGRKLLLTAMILVHLAVFLPLLTLVHVFLADSFSLIVLPTLFLIFGLLLHVMVFVAFYGWGMSWPSSLWVEKRPA